jgi:chromosome segregation ATPase
VRLFGQRTTELETTNRILTESARERAERVEELERDIDAHERMRAQLSDRNAELDRTLLAARARIKELEDHNRQLTDAATNRAARVQDLEQELSQVRTEFAVKDFPRVEAERDFYRKRMQELEMHNQQLTEAATKYALRAQELESLRSKPARKTQE